VNGEVIVDPAFGVIPGRDRVLLDGRLLEASEPRRYFLLNKPAGVIVSRADTHGRITVYNLLGKAGKGVFPVGRLDVDTSGVLLLTDDGDLAYRLTHPSFGVEKVYRAVVRGRVAKDDVRTIEEGIVLDDGPTAPASLRILGRDRRAPQRVQQRGPRILHSKIRGARSHLGPPETSTVELTLHQGRKRQVRRMLDCIGHPVITLERISFGGITAEGIPQGAYRPLTGEEVARLKVAEERYGGSETDRGH
jgi:23S rRNA pseudouridine2605 synthase